MSYGFTAKTKAAMRAKPLDLTIGRRVFFGSLTKAILLNDCLLRRLAVVAAMVTVAAPLRAQMPFYTDDTSVTETNKFHIEVFDEFDGLQASQYPDLRQNTANVRFNYSPWAHLELDIDAPYIAIERTAAVQSSRGVGDTNLGAKWNLRETPQDSLLPSFAVSLYIEFPTGDARQELGSGLTDYWLNFIVQKPISETTRYNVNLGVLFAGNTSTGAVGVQTRHGQVYTGGLSLLHDVTPRLTIGAEIYGGLADSAGLDGTQLQALLGLQFEIRDGLTVSLGILGGKYGATPQIGGQIGFSMDFPDLFGSSSRGQ
jgi:hypothetical protein